MANQERLTKQDPTEYMTLDEKSDWITTKVDYKLWLLAQGATTLFIGVTAPHFNDASIEGLAAKGILGVEVAATVVSAWYALQKSSAMVKIEKAAQERIKDEGSDN